MNNNKILLESDKIKNIIKNINFELEFKPEEKLTTPVNVAVPSEAILNLSAELPAVTLVANIKGPTVSFANTNCEFVDS